MTDQLDNAEILTTIDLFIQAGKHFTAWEITKATRSRLFGKVNVFHSQVRRVVHDYYAQGGMPGYQRTLVPHPHQRGDEEMWLYHVQGTLPEQTNTPKVRKALDEFVRTATSLLPQFMGAV